MNYSVRVVVTKLMQCPKDGLLRTAVIFILKGVFMVLATNPLVGKGSLQHFHFFDCEGDKYVSSATSCHSYKTLNAHYIEQR